MFTTRHQLRTIAFFYMSSWVEIYYSGTPTVIFPLDTIFIQTPHQNNEFRFRRVHSLVKRTTISTDSSLHLLSTFDKLPLYKTLPFSFVIFNIHTDTISNYTKDTRHLDYCLQQSRISCMNEEQLLLAVKQQLLQKEWNQLALSHQRWA